MSARCTDQYRSPNGYRWVTCEKRRHHRGAHRVHYGIHLITWKVVGF